MSRVVLHEGDCRRTLAYLHEMGLRVDAVVCDPPYHLTSIVRRWGKDGCAPQKSGGPTGVYARASSGFMGQQWDGGDIAFRPAFWRLAWRLLKPGGHLVAFSADRTYHRMACAIEDAGFEVRHGLLDMVAGDTHVRRFMASLTGEQLNGFLRCLLEAETGPLLAWVYGSGFPKSHDISKALDKATDAACAFDGWGTALKPAWEPIILARKPLDGTVAANVRRHGVGGLNIDGCRVHAEDACGGVYTVRRMKSGAELSRTGGTWRPDDGVEFHGEMKPGRWPANVLHDGSDDVLASFPDAPGQLARVGPEHGARATVNVYGDYGARPVAGPRGDTGSAARFYYSAKADAEDRWGSKHPTVKPVNLMRWLVRLVTPPGGLVLDPFAGSGTTGVAALAEGMRAVLCEREGPYCADIRARIDHYSGASERHSLAVKARNRAVDDAGPLFGGHDQAVGGGRIVYGQFAADKSVPRG